MSTTADPVAATRAAIGRLLTAIESRDLRRITAALTPDATWRNVPEPPAEGRAAVVAMLAGILGWSDVVRWDIVSAAYDGTDAWLERVDRFWIAGDEHSVRCNGVFSVDPETACVRSVRDYADLAEWRARIGPVYAAQAERDPATVIARHLDAVRRGDTVAMASDYALDAILVRGRHRCEGWAPIADYFDTVPERLGTDTVHFEPIETIDDRTATVAWTIGPHHGAGRISGTDRFTVDSGRITHQLVELDADDF